jgi:hypothetical protein
VRYLAAHPGQVDRARDNPDRTVREAVRAQWRGDVPGFVGDWLAQS